MVDEKSSKAVSTEEQHVEKYHVCGKYEDRGESSWKVVLGG